MKLYLKAREFGGYPRTTTGGRPDDRFRALQEPETCPVDYVHPHYGPLYPVSHARSKVQAPRLPRYVLRVKRPQGGVGAVRCSTRSEVDRLIARLPSGVNYSIEDLLVSSTTTGIA